MFLRTLKNSLLIALFCLMLGTAEAEMREIYGINMESGQVKQLDNRLYSVELYGTAQL